MTDTPSTPREGLQELAALHQQIAELEATKDYAAQIVETVRDPLLVLTPDFRVQLANPAFYQLFQIHPADTVGQCLYDLGHGQWNMPELRRLLEDILSANAVFNDYAVTHDFAQIGRRTMLLNARRLDNLQLILLAIEDVTVRQQAQEALRLHHELFDVALASIGDAVIATDTQGRITFLNRVAATLTGWPRDEACGQPIGAVLRLFHAHTRQPLVDPVTRVLQDGRAVGLAHHTTLRTRDGREVAIADSCAPIWDQAGVLHGVVLVFRDVSEERRRQDELFRARKIESVGVLAGGIAHDFNNLLTAILGNISLAKMLGGTDARVAARLTEAEHACQRATALTQQLLTFARGGAPVRHPVALHDLLHQAVTFALHGTNVRSDVALPATLWPVDADAGQLSQVLHNIVLNAVQAMPQGGTVQVRAENVAWTTSLLLPLPEGRYIKITVRDHGGGIPAAVLPNIFDPYFTTKATGSGLGLATAYAIVTKHDGHLMVESEEGVGTTFFIYLPAAQQPLAAAPVAEAVPLGGSGRILVMDDDVAIRDLLRELLTSVGYTVEVAGDGTEALACFQRAQAEGHPFRAVILDITIPGGTGGLDTIARLRALDPQVKALISSGYATDPVMANYAQYGFDGVVPKPYTVQRVQQILQRVLRQP
jgi:two-component system cell cycle sensor histidine kinase/response regulator CckA